MAQLCASTPPAVREHSPCVRDISPAARVSRPRTNRDRRSPGTCPVLESLETFGPAAARSGDLASTPPLCASTPPAVREHSPCCARVSRPRTNRDRRSPGTCPVLESLETFGPAAARSGDLRRALPLLCASTPWSLLCASTPPAVRGSPDPAPCANEYFLRSLLICVSTDVG